MLTKLTCFLLLFTLAFLFISYLFELVLALWLANKSSTVLSASTSPSDFGIDQLKLILGFRGIYYAKQFSDKNNNNVQQKEKLAELVATSGQISQDELLQLRLDELATSESSRQSSTGRLKVFASAKLMEEEIDDNHIWLLYISQNDDENEPMPDVWTKLVQQFGKFDLRFARFDCKADSIYCHRRRWLSPRLVLVFPKSRYELEKRIFNYPLESQTQATNVIHWLQGQLSSQLSPIYNIDTLLQPTAKQFNPSANLVNVVAIMGEQFRKSPPLSLSLLALRFRDRITFGVHFASPDSLFRLHSTLKTNINPKLPIYLVQHSSDSLIVYNANSQAPLSYSQMDVYLRGLTLDSNDLYLALFSLANLFLGLNFFWTRCMTAKRHLFLCVIKAVEVNSMILMSLTVVWPLIASFASSCLQVLPQNYLTAEQWFNWINLTWSSSVAFQFRAQVLSPFMFERFVVAFISSGVILLTLRRNKQLCLFNNNHYDDELIKSVFYWVSVIGCFVGFLLFRKTRPVRRRHHGLDHERLQMEQMRNSGAEVSGDGTLAAGNEEWPEMEEDVDEGDDLELEEEHIDLDSDLDRLLLESMFSGMANLWLQPELISTDYIYQLPVWQVKEDEHFVQTTVEESSSSTSSSTDISDSEEFSRRESVPDVYSNRQAPTTTDPASSEPHASSSKKQHTESESCPKKSTKEAPAECCCENKLTECSSNSPVSKTNEHISFQIRVKLEEKKRKIIRIRRKRSKRSTSAAETVQQQEEQKQADLELCRPEWMLDFNDCTICLDAYRNAQTIIGLACGHNYHRDCLTQWLVRDTTMKRATSDPMADKAVSNDKISKQQLGGRSTTAERQGRNRKSSKEVKSPKAGDQVDQPPRSFRQPPPILMLKGNEIGKIGPSKADSSFIQPTSTRQAYSSNQELERCTTQDSVDVTSTLLDKNKAMYGGRSKVVDQFLPDVASTQPTDSVNKIGASSRLEKTKTQVRASSTAAHLKIPSPRKSVRRSSAHSKSQKSRSRSKISPAKSNSPKKSNKLKSRTGDKSTKSPKG